MGAKLNDAVNFATVAYNGLVRRRDSLPYILHPLEVMAIIGTMTADEDVLIAGLLHDTIEDCGITKEEIRDRFGERVMNLVLSETEPSFPGEREEDTWLRRKERSLTFLENAEDPGTAIMWLADKLSNTRSFYRAYREEGDAFINFLHMKDRTKLFWYYDTIRQNLTALSGSAAYDEYSWYVDRLFGPRGEKADGSAAEKDAPHPAEA